MILAAARHRYLQLTHSRFAGRGSSWLEHLRSTLDHSSPHLSRKRQLSHRTVGTPNEPPHIDSVQHTPICLRRHQQHPSPASRATASRLRPTPRNNRSASNSLRPRSLARSVACRRHSARATATNVWRCAGDRGDGSGSGGDDGDGGTKSAERIGRRTREIGSGREIREEVEVAGTTTATATPEAPGDTRVPRLAALLALSERRGACSGRLRLPSFASLRSTHPRRGSPSAPAPSIPTPATALRPQPLTQLPVGMRSSVRVCQ